MSKFVLYQPLTRGVTTEKIDWEKLCQASGVVIVGKHEDTCAIDGTEEQVEQLLEANPALRATTLKYYKPAGN